jgi:hypothetical protein
VNQHRHQPSEEDLRNHNHNKQQQQTEIPVGIRRAATRQRRQNHQNVVSFEGDVMMTKTAAARGSCQASGKLRHDDNNLRQLKTEDILGKNHSRQDDNKICSTVMSCRHTTNDMKTVTFDIRHDDKNHALLHEHKHNCIMATLCT